MGGYCDWNKDAWEKPEAESVRLVATEFQGMHLIVLVA